MRPISRIEARERGLTRFFTGEPCKHGHRVERLTLSGKCLQCHREASARQFKQQYHSDPTFRDRHNETASNWKKTNRQHVTGKNREWHRKNPGKNKEYCLRWWKDNREKVRLSNKKWRQNNRARVKRTFKDWESRNPERAAMHRRVGKTNRRSADKLAGLATVNDIQFLFRQQRNRCAGCGAKHARLEVDHILAVSKGGTSARNNLQLLCRGCNRDKSAKDAMEWAQEHGRLL